MKKLLLIITALTLSFTLFGCIDENSEEYQPIGGDGTVDGMPEHFAFITTDMTNGAINKENLTQHNYYYDGELTVEMISDKLSEITGLNFEVTLTEETEEKLIVDWGINSTLFTDLGDEPQKEEFFFYDSYSMRWFMLDSMWQSLKDYTIADHIYFTMDGGKDFDLPEFNDYYLNPISSNEPYLGSSYYVPTVVPVNMPALITGPLFTGMTPLENIDNFRGGYYYSDMTEDGLTVIINSAIWETSVTRGISIENHIALIAEEFSEADVMDLEIVSEPTYSENITYPVYTMNWTTGSNEDTRGWTAFFFETDIASYFFAFNSQVDVAHEMSDVWYSIFGQLTLADN